MKRSIAHCVTSSSRKPGEAADAPDSDVATELTDLQEVMEALVEVYGLAPAAVRGCRGTAVLLATGQLPA